MQIERIVEAGDAYTYTWPGGDDEEYRAWVDYSARSEDGQHTVRIGFGTRKVWQKDRERVVIWIDGYPQAEFFGADDFDSSGEVLSDIWVRREDREVMCRYPDDPIPERYSRFVTVGLPTRVSAKGLRNSWVIVANVSDHDQMIALAALRRLERK